MATVPGAGISYSFKRLLASFHVSPRLVFLFPRIYLSYLLTCLLTYLPTYLLTVFVAAFLLTYLLTHLPTYLLTVFVADFPFYSFERHGPGGRHPPSPRRVHQKASGGFSHQC